MRLFWVVVVATTSRALALQRRPVATAVTTEKGWADELRSDVSETVADVRGRLSRLFMLRQARQVLLSPEKKESAPPGPAKTTFFGADSSVVGPVLGFLLKNRIARDLLEVGVQVLGMIQLYEWGQRLATSWQATRDTHVRRVRQRATLAKTRLAKLVPEPLGERFALERRNVERRIHQLVSRHDPAYLVVVGPSGAGKTFAVRKVLADRPNVVHLELLSKSEQTLEDAVRAKLGEEDLEGGLVELLEPFRGADKKPVLVVEVSDASSATKHQEKVLEVVEKGLAHGIFVVNDAVPVGTSDVVWLGGLDDQGALDAFLDAWGVLRESPDVRRRLLADVGALLPRDLDATAREALRQGDAAPAVKRELHRAVFERFIDTKQAAAADDVDALLTQSLTKETERDLVLALLSGDNVGGDPASAVGHFGVYTFNSETNTFQFASKAHEHAARRWFAEEASRAARLAS